MKIINDHNQMALHSFTKNSLITTTRPLSARELHRNITTKTGPERRHTTDLTKSEIPLLLLRHLGEGSEGEGALDLADVVLQDGLGGERLGQVEAVLYLE